MKRFFIILNMLVCIASCTLITTPEEAPQQNLPDRETSLVAEAALELRQSFYGNTSVKSSNPENLSIFRMETLLKSTSSCTPYLINYPNDEGYSIMLADGENIRPLMISDIGALDPQVLQNAINGNTPSNTPTPTPIEPAPIDEDEGLEPEDAPHGDEHIEPFPMDILPFDYNPPITGAQPNPGYNENIPPMIDEIVDYINNGGNGNRLDTAINEIPGTTPKPPAPCPDSLKGKWLQMWGVAPLIKTAWDQDIPYNIYCPTINNEYTLAGCAPIAASQIGAHLAPPGTSWDWELIIGTDSISKDAAAKFIAYTGEIMNADYGLANTGASIYDAKRFLKNSIGCKNLSIRTCKDFTKFYDRVTGRLKYHLPVYTRGKNSNGEGHAYIIDGYVEQKKYIGDYAMERRSLFHINWGWGGKHNGWYLADLLDCSKEIKEGAPQTATIPTGSGPNIYDGGMQTLTYMIPEWMQ